MSIYFDFKTINELTGFDDYRQQKEYTLEELAQYNGSNGRPAYVAIEGVIYDVSNLETWDEGMHFGLMAGQDLSEQFYSCHGIVQILKNAPKVGTLLDEDDMDDMNGMDNMNNTNGMSNMNRYYSTPMNRQVAQQDTSKFTPDDWIRYITPLVTYALREPSQGMNSQRIYQKAILMGVLVGLGRSPQEAINQVQQWQNSGASQLLKVGTGTTGGMGTDGGTGTGTGTTGGMGTGGGTGTGTGATGGMGTSGGTGTGMGTTGGMGAGGGTGTGMGTTGGMGTSGGTGTGMGTIGGMGTAGGMGTGAGTGGMGTTGGFGAGTGTGASGGTMGTGGGTGIGGSMGTGGGTGGNTGTGNMGSRNRLIFDE